MIFRQMSIIILCAIFTVSCAGKSVYINPTAITETSTRYSDTDERIIADDMVNSLLSTNKIYEGGGTPTIILGRIENKTTQYIDMSSILKRIMTLLVNSDKVRFVNREGKILDQMAAEQALTQTLGESSSSLKTGRIMGGKFRLDGEMTEITQAGGKIRSYAIRLWLTNNETSEQVWINEKEIKKVQK